MNAVAPITALNPAQWIALDIETGDADEAAVAAAVEAWKPPANSKTADEINAEAARASAEWKPPANITDAAKIEERRRAAIEKIESERLEGLAKIEERRKEAAAKRAERAALLDASPILCVSVHADTGAHAFNGMDGSRPEVQGWTVWPCGGEKGMLLALKAWLDAATTPSTILVGHNCRGFDLPKLRQAYIRHGLRLPEILRPRLRGEESAEIVDTMDLCRSFSMENRQKDRPISLETMARVLGIPRPKAVISGADVPKLHREGRFAEILTYCCVDAATTSRAYQLMLGIAPDLS